MQEGEEITFEQLEQMRQHGGITKQELQKVVERAKAKSFKRENKNRPMEMSSKRPVPRLREVVEGTKRYLHHLTLLEHQTSWHRTWLLEVGLAPLSRHLISLPRSVLCYCFWESRTARLNSLSGTLDTCRVCKQHILHVAASMRPRGAAALLRCRCCEGKQGCNL